MLKKEINLLILVLFLLHGCKSDKGKAKESTNKYVAEHFNGYQPIYNQITDSIRVYIDSMLGSYMTEYYREWHVDSLLCINSSNDKLITTVNQSFGVNIEIANDQIEKLLGKKINGKWYFFKAGESLTVPRDIYGKSGSDPLSFYELSQIARREFLEGALVEQADGKFQVNDEFIDHHFYSSGWGSYPTKAGFDSAHSAVIKNQWLWKRIDTNEYKPMRKHKFNR